MKKLCSNCFDWKPLSSFHKKKEGYQYNCKVCSSKLKTQYVVLRRDGRPKAVNIKLNFTGDEWQQILLEMGDKQARKYLVSAAKEKIINKVFGLKESYENVSY